MRTWGTEIIYRCPAGKMLDIPLNRQGMTRHTIQISVFFSGQTFFSSKEKIMKKYRKEYEPQRYKGGGVPRPYWIDHLKEKLNFYVCLP